jgi:hypothetical protein
MDIQGRLELHALAYAIASHPLGLITINGYLLVYCRIHDKIIRYVKGGEKFNISFMKEKTKLGFQRVRVREWCTFWCQGRED